MKARPLPKRIDREGPSPACGSTLFQDQLQLSVVLPRYSIRG
jgi:hypothetical protein